MTDSPVEPAEFIIRTKYRLYDLAISLASCAVFMLVMGPVGGIIWTSVLLVHEFGHFALGFRFTGRPPAIVIYPLLGLTLAPGMSRRPTQENLAFALGGVWMSIVVALPLLPLTRFSDTGFAYVAVSLVLNAINALPIPGLDGGRVCMMLARSLPGAWPRIVAVALFLFAFAFAAWLNDLFLWVILGIATLVSIRMVLRAVKWPFAPLAPFEAISWFAVYMLTLTVLGHLLWIMLSEWNSVFRIFLGLGLAVR